MLMIIGHHAVGHGGSLGMQPCINRWIAYFIVPGGKICFDTFIAISAWFLVDQSFKAERFAKMWLEVLFYSVLTINIAALLGSRFTGIEWISAFLPITGGVQGYAQTYLAFYLMIPLLTKVSKNSTKKQNLYVIASLSIFVFLYRITSGLIWSEQSLYCRLVLFVFIYFLMLYLKRYPFSWLDNKIVPLLIFICGWLTLFTYNVFAVLYPNWAGWKYFTILIIDEGGILYLITGLALFFFFKNIKIKHCKWINILGGATFAVLLIHDGHFSRNWTWQLLHTTDWLYDKYYFVEIILCEIFIYLICTVIDVFRKNIIEQAVFKCNWLKRLCVRWDDIFTNESINNG